MSQKEKTSDNKYFTVQGLKEHLQKRNQEFDSILDCGLYRMNKEITSLLAVYDYLTPEEITTRFYQLTIVQAQKARNQKRQGSEARRRSFCWRHLWNKLKFWNIRTSKKSEGK
ncbi:hypothetical protein GCK72_004418 [Caenorhabditis remanei]|uniref:Uncharacterized protein n=1 Tax=Caenorhabditis remanei TaxID=31234 RepID=A0A6A5H9G8_CAERE|nr:hypothetical protein GCK72_004418 [Caenorhabditis remanei]KAF1764470.1 hypothetical protein GCK72_004418 [Caenorhabditis remanei]